MLLLLLATLYQAACTGDSVPTPPAAPPPRRIEGGVFRGGFMYWAPAPPLLAKGRRLVLAGTVAEVHPGEDSRRSGSLRIERVLLSQATPQEQFISAETMTGASDREAPGRASLLWAVLPRPLAWSSFPWPSRPSGGSKTASTEPPPSPRKTGGTSLP
ncbi:MAG: hypothetical protein ABIO70_22115 [Pseudomonadota bacterium]